MGLKSYFISKNSEIFHQLSILHQEIESTFFQITDFVFLDSTVDYYIPAIYFIDSTFVEYKENYSKLLDLQHQYNSTICFVQTSLEDRIDFSSYPFSINTILYLFQPKELALQTLQCVVTSAKILSDSFRSTLRYREIINEVTNLFSLINEKSEFVYSSPSMKHLHGYGEGELQGKSFINFIHPDDLSVVMEEFQKTLNSTTYNPVIQFRLKTKMGHYVTLEAQANNQLHNPDIRAIIVNSKDITEFKSVESNLRLKEERISKAFSLTGLGIWDYDVKNDIVIFNNQMFDLLGVPFEDKEFSFDEYVSLFGSSNSSKFHEAIKKCFIENKPFYVEHSLFHSQPNETVWVLDRGAVVEWNLINQPTRVIGTTTDITKRKTIEIELKKSHENLNKLTNNIPGVLYQFHKSVDGEYSFPYFSSQASEMFGVKDSKNSINLIDHLHIYHPEDLPGLLESINESAQNLTIWESEFRVILPNKGVQWRKGVARPELLEDGSILWHGYMSDSTEQRKIEEQLTIKDTVIENSINGNVIFNLEGYITYSNTAFETMWGFEEEDFNEQINMSDLFVERKAGFNLLTCLLIDESWTGELEAKSIQNNRIFYANIVATLVKTPEGSPLCIYASVVDVTEKKQIEEIFLRNQRMDSIGTLAGGIAHDLNNVLTPILLSIEILKLQTKDDRFLQRLDLIENSTKRGAELIKQVLHFSRGVEGERSAIQVKKLTDEMVMIMKSTFPKNILNSIMLEQHLPPIMGDDTQLHQVLLNLCVNARDAMPDGGLISISAKKVTNTLEGKFAYLGLKGGEYVQLSVSDTGTGMPKEVREKVFEPFFTTKEIGQGTGIGLSTVMSIIKSHKGAIFVESEEAKGTTFDIYFPIEDEPETIEESPMLQSTSNKKNIGVLVVDDEEAIREFSTLALEPLGYKVFTACDYSDAIHQFTKNVENISLLVVDMILPGPDGKEIIKTIRETNPTFPCLAVSGVHHTFDEDTLFNDVVFLQKPYTTFQFLNVIQSLI